MLRNVSPVRTRYAPSPTGSLHVGGARTALFCYLFARHHNGIFVVRTEDTDQVRNVAGGEANQLENLAWLGVVPDESALKPNPKYAPYRQSERTKTYHRWLQTLFNKGWARYCYDTPTELALQKAEQKARGVFSFRYDASWLKLSPAEIKARHTAKSYVVRVFLPKNQQYVWSDMVRGRISVASSAVSDFVVLRGENGFTYNFTCVVDDHLMAITHVLRSAEHVSNTPKQLALYKMFNWKPPLFGHLNTITDTSGKKMSKRAANPAHFLTNYVAEGYLPQAVFNYLALLGWHPKTTVEKMPSALLVKSFSPSGLVRSPSQFDLQKLRWFSQAYFQDLTPQDLRKVLLPFLPSALRQKPVEWQNLFFKTCQPQLYAASQVKKLARLYSEELPVVQVGNPCEANTALKAFAKFFPSLEDFALETVSAALKTSRKAAQTGGARFFMPLRLVLTRSAHGPDLATTLYLLGYQKVYKRLQTFLKTR